jgi:hypothetical protein
MGDGPRRARRPVSVCVPIDRVIERTAHPDRRRGQTYRPRALVLTTNLMPVIMADRHIVVSRLLDHDFPTRHIGCYHRS